MSNEYYYWLFNSSSDEVFADRKTEMKMKNHKYSEKAKSVQRIEASNRFESRWFCAFEDQHKLRDRYLLKNILSGEATILKLLHSEDSNTATTISRKEITVQLENIYKADNFTKVKHQYTVPVEKKKTRQNWQPPGPMEAISRKMYHTTITQITLLVHGIKKDQCECHAKDADIVHDWSERERWYVWKDVQRN